jgi:hypothetical protein
MPSPQPLRCEFRLVAKGAGFCTPGGSRAPAGLMPSRSLWMWQLSTSAVKGGTQVFSPTRKRAGRSASQGASTPSREAQHDSPRTAAHPSSAASPESRRSGGRGVFSGVFRLKPAPPPGGRQRLDPPPTSQAPPPVRRGRRRTPSGGTETTLQTHISILQILREADKQYSRRGVSNTKPAPRRRQTAADLDPYLIMFIAQTDY